MPPRPSRLIIWYTPPIMAPGAKSTDAGAIGPAGWRPVKEGAGAFFFEAQKPGCALHIRSTVATAAGPGGIGQQIGADAYGDVLSVGRAPCLAACLACTGGGLGGHSFVHWRSFHPCPVLFLCTLASSQDLGRGQSCRNSPKGRILQSHHVFFTCALLVCQALTRPVFNKAQQPLFVDRPSPIGN